jgi:hypothetical protein
MTILKMASLPTCSYGRTPNTPKNKDLLVKEVPENNDEESIKQEQEDDERKV